MWKFTGQERPPLAQEPGPGQESVWDYPRPPRLAEEKRKVRVLYKGATIAETVCSVRVLETASPPTFYLPPDDVKMDLLDDVGQGSRCEWKGTATYWSVRVKGEQLDRVGWSYHTPTERFADIRGYLSFYPAWLECYVGDERVRPQGGGFYGGWVTDEIVGPYKGEPGTSGW